MGNGTSLMLILDLREQLLIPFWNLYSDLGHSLPLQNNTKWLLRRGCSDKLGSCIRPSEATAPDWAILSPIGDTNDIFDKDVYFSLLLFLNLCICTTRARASFNSFDPSFQAS